MGLTSARDAGTVHATASVERATVPARPATDAAVVLTLAAGVAFQLSAGAMPNASAATATQKFLAHPTAAHAYRASRRLEAAGSGQHAWLDAQTTFTPATGLHYEVTAEGGSGYIRSRVLRSLLEAERELIAGGRSASVAISPANYRFTPEAIDAEGLAQVALQPLRKDRSLIVGRMFLNPSDGALLRVEGRLAKNPSFWVTRVNIVRRYERLNGALMPVSLQSTAQLRLLGRSTLHMTYNYSHIDDRPVNLGRSPELALVVP